MAPVIALTTWCRLTKTPYLRAWHLVTAGRLKAERHGSHFFIREDTPAPPAPKTRTAAAVKTAS